jgi:hypothetical protein
MNYDIDEFFYELLMRLLEDLSTFIIQLGLNYQFIRENSLKTVLVK